MNTFSREKERAEADGGKMYGDYEMEGRVDEVRTSSGRWKTVRALESGFGQ